MNRTSLGVVLFAAFFLYPAAAALGLDLSVAAVNGDLSRTLLGDGTGVVIGVIDSGVDETHPALAGVDSLGQPRMVAEANFVTYEASTGGDVSGHGTAVAGVILGSDLAGANDGFAPDARFVNARVLDDNTGFMSEVQVLNGVGYAIDQGADVLNLSLNFFSTSSSGNLQLDLMLDWAASERGILAAISAGNISQAQGETPEVRGPGGSYNGLTVGRTDLEFDQVHPNSANAFTQNNRMKPDLVAPGTSINSANTDWEDESDYVSVSGTSFSTPHVVGLLAQQIEAGETLGLSTSPLVLKATMMNSASKDVLDKDGDPWSASATNLPLDTDSGAGQIDGLQLAEQYLAGEQEAGLVDAVGWDLGSVGFQEFVDYEIDASLINGSELTATLTWFRNVSRTDRGLAGIDSSDLFVSETLDNLDLQLLRDGQLVALSNSLVDNVEHFTLTVDPEATYTLRVVGTSIFGESQEAFALAWSASGVPEPTTLALGAIALLGLFTRPRASRCRAA